MKTKDEIIKEVIGISEDAPRLTPMDKGECKLVMIAWSTEVVKNLTIPVVVGQSEQLLAVAEYVYNHFDDSSSKTAKDYLQDFLS